MEVRHLKSFCVIAEELHVTRAAARLGVAQPALTQHVRALEEELKTPLLRRVGRNVELTEAGIAFHREAIAILEQIQRASLATQEVGRGVRGHLILGMSEAAGFSKAVTGLFERFSKKYTKTSLGFRQGSTAEMLELLEAGRVDVAIVCPPVPAPPRFAQLQFLTEPVVLALPRKHALSGRKSLSIGALKEQALILHNDADQGRCLDNGLRTACIAAGFIPKVVQQTPDLILALNLVAAGVGLAVVPQSIRGVRSHEISYVKLTSNPALVHSLIITTRYRETSTVTANFLCLAQAHRSAKAI